MAKNNLEMGLPKEQLRQFLQTTPEARLKWLEDVQEFVKKNVGPKKIKLWQKIKR